MISGLLAVRIRNRTCCGCSRCDLSPYCPEVTTNTRATYLYFPDRGRNATFEEIQLLKACTYVLASLMKNLEIHICSLKALHVATYSKIETKSVSLGLTPQQKKISETSPPGLTPH
nr:hypothetical protein [Tanacetum cinerariifolium]